MRSKIIGDFKELGGKNPIGGLTDFVLFGRAIVSKQYDKLRIQKAMKKCLDLTKTDFTFTEAIEHFTRLTRLEPEGYRKPKVLPHNGSTKPKTSTQK